MSEPRAHKASAIMFRRRNETVLAFCRGTEKGCTKNIILQSKVGPCADCKIADNPNEKIGDFLARMEQPDA